MGQGDVGHDAPRETAPIIAMAMVGYVRDALGRAAAGDVARVLGPATCVNDVIDDPNRWYSIDEVLAMASLARELTGDVEIGRRSGEQLYRSMLATGVVDFLRSTGSIAVAASFVHESGSKSSAGRLLSTVETGESHLVFVAPFTNDVLPPDATLEHRFFCDFLAGFYSQIPSAFGCLGTVVETSCQLRGARRCEFRLAWRTDPTAEQSSERHADQPGSRSTGVIERFEELQSMASDLVAVDDVDGLLSRIIGHVGRALPAPQHLLVVDPGDGRHRIQTVGLAADEGDELARQLLAGDLDPRPDVVAVPVRSGEREFGRMAAVFPGGTTGSKTDERLLIAYANHAAAALNVIGSLQAARRDRDTAEALLTLARKLAEVGSSQEIAERLCEAVPHVVACTAASVSLYDAESGALAVVAATIEDQSGAGLDAHVFSELEVPAIPDLAADPRPVIADLSMASPAIKRSLAAFGLVRIAAAPIHSRGELLGYVNAGFAEHDHAEETDAELIRRLSGLADHAATALENAKLLDRMRHAATHDRITGLPNRVLVEERSGQALDAAEPGRGVGLLFVDLDRFKDVNDSLGHHTGDELIRSVGARLLSVLDPGQTLGRLGGDEFIVLAPDLGGVADGKSLAERLLGALREPFEMADQELFVSCSIGIAVSPVHGSTYESLLQYADAAMYSAKAAGGGTFAVEAATVSSPKRDQLRLEGHLHRALENDELRVHYQPQVELSTGRITGAEALIRWEHPTEGLLLPGSFLPLAEKTGLVVAMDDFVRREAFAQAKAWRDAGHDLHMAVNLSARSLANPDLAARVDAELRACRVDPASIELEISENLVMSDIDELPRVLEPLRALGVRIAIDDFGTGSSVLRRLQHCRIETLKIDRSFLSGITRPWHEVPLIKALLSMARGLDLTVVAEGVETEVQADLLNRYGCELAQGWYYSAAVPAAELQRSLDEAKPSRPTPPLPALTH